MDAPFTVRFDADPVTPNVARVFGLGAAEEWGRWSNDLRIGIHFDRPLPASFEARIACAVAPANRGRVMTIIVGSCMRRWVSNKTLAEGLGIETVRFQGDPARVLEIHLPAQERAGGSDPRVVGLALASIEIVPVAPPGGRDPAPHPNG